MNTLRRIVFYILLLVYVVGTPFIILYALGYIYRPGEGNGDAQSGLIKTGLVYLSTVPPGAQIYLGRKKYPEKTPAVLRELLPGRYDIRMTYKNYRSWSMTIPIEAGKATVLDRILLLPEQLKPEILAADRFQNLVTLPKTPYILLLRGETVKDAVFLNREKRMIFPLLSETEKKITDFEVTRIFTTAKSPYLLLALKYQDAKKFLWIHLDGEHAEVQDISKLFRGEPEQVTWDPSQPRYLWIYRNGVLDRANLENETIFPHFSESLRGFGIYDKEVYLLAQDSIVKTNFDGRHRQLLLEDPELFQSLFGADSQFRIFPLTRKFVLFLSAGGRLLGTKLPYQYVREKVEGFQYGESKKLAIWQDDKIGVIHLGDDDLEEGIFERGARLTWVYSGGNGIKNVFWVYEGSQLLFQEKDTVFLSEIDTFGERKVTELLKVKEDSLAEYSEEDGMLYFLDPQTGALAVQEILPKQQIVIFPFPEIEFERKIAKMAKSEAL